MRKPYHPSIGELVSVRWPAQPYASRGSTMWSMQGKWDGYQDRDERGLHADNIGIVVRERSNTSDRGGRDIMVLWGNELAWFCPQENSFFRIE